MNRADAFSKYLAPKRHMPREYKDRKIGDAELGASVLARMIVERLLANNHSTHYAVIVDIDRMVYMCGNGPRVREFVDLHTNLVVGMYDRGVHVEDLVSDLENFLQEVA